MGDGSSVFTQPSRFLTEGNILKQHVTIESAGEFEAIDELDIEDILEDKPARDQEFLDMMRNYFRQED